MGVVVQLQTLKGDAQDDLAGARRPAHPLFGLLKTFKTAAAMQRDFPKPGAKGFQSR